METVTDKPQGHAALRHGRVSLAHHVYHVTTATPLRRRVFDDFNAACAASAAFTHATSLGDARLLAWTLMPDHAHWLLQLGAQDPLGLVVNRMKARSAAAVNRVVGDSGAVWARGFHDHAVRREEDLSAIARYIIANPIRAGLVTRAADYPFWDAIWL